MRFAQFASFLSYVKVQGNNQYTTLLQFISAMFNFHKSYSNKSYVTPLILNGSRDKQKITTKHLVVPTRGLFSSNTFLFYTADSQGQRG